MTNDRFDIIPYIAVHPTSINLYNRIIWNVPHSIGRQSNEVGSGDSEVHSSFLNSSRKANGKVSTHAKRKMSRAIEYLVATTNTRKQYEPQLRKWIVFKATFLTLTLPSAQMHDDREIINKCLNPFLQEIIKYHVVKKYIWRAEKQQNGNIHFHILTDSFIPYYQIRDRWNRVVNRLGYVDRFQERHGRKQPNSTDIHSLRKIKNLKKYMIKYMAKNEETTQNNNRSEDSQKTKELLPDEKAMVQTGRIWGCSHNLSKIQGYRTEIDNETAEQLTKVIESGKAKKYESTYFTVLNINYKDLRKIGADLLFNYFANYLFETFDYSEQLEI